MCLLVQNSGLHNKMGSDMKRRKEQNGTLKQAGKRGSAAAKEERSRNNVSKNSEFSVVRRSQYIRSLLFPPVLLMLSLPA